MARSCYRTFVVDGDLSFEDLATDILNVFDFDHLYEFRTTLRRTGGTIMYSYGEFFYPFSLYSEDLEDESVDTDECKEIEYEDPDPDYGEYDINRPLIHLNPPKGTKFYFNYDFGDNWLFVIHVFEAETDKNFSKGSICIKSVGKVEHYYQDDFDEEDE